MAATAYAGGWKHLADVFEKVYQSVDADKQAAFTDLFFYECLKLVDGNDIGNVIWLIAGKWHSFRKLSLNGYDLTQSAEEHVYQFLILLRRKLRKRLEINSSALPAFSEDIERSLMGMWSGVFLSSYSVLNQKEEPGISDVLTVSPRISSESPSYCQWLLRMSMYYPFDADRFMIDVEQLLKANIPAYEKVILAMWLVNIPRYNATQYHRQKIMVYFHAIERMTRKEPTWMDPYFHLLAEWFMTALFRMAYIHEDNTQTTFLFGEFVTSQMKRFFPQFTRPFPAMQSRFYTRRRIRVGYVSTRFVTNAVTFYMANRILHHDPATFEIHVFALGTQHDGMTKLIAEHSDRFLQLENVLDYQANAQAIRESELDILVFADIGMGIPTYLLAGLRLAPLQVALLGHASSTGLPTIDCFFSSQVEPAQAQDQYREKLIRLSNVGASQIMPPALQTGLTHSLSRQKLSIPENAFVFVSCANGMKHIPERDFIWVEILRRIPHAYILIKPFIPGDYDRKLVERLARVGKLADAPERIRYVGSYDGHNDVFGLLSLANAQLDSYPFNGWTTTIEAICLALPTITQEGQGYRSRLGAGFLRAMGVTEGIAASEEEYIEWAVKFANDPSLCNWVKNRIKATRRHLLFDNAALQGEYEKALIEMIRGMEATKGKGD